MKASIWYTKKYLMRKKKLITLLSLAILLVSVFVSFEFAFYYQIEFRNRKTLDLYNSLIKIWFTDPIPIENISELQNIQNVDRVYPFIHLSYEIKDLTSNENIVYPVEFVNISLLQILLNKLDFHVDLKGDIFIGFSIALKIGAKPGDLIEIGGVNLTVHTILPQTFSDLDYFIFMNISFYIKNLARAELKNKANGAYIFVRDQNGIEKIANDIHNTYNIRYMITPSNLVERIERLNRIQLISSLFFSTIAVITGFSIILIYLYRDLEMRKRELALLISLGARRKQVMLFLLIPLIITLIIPLIIGCITAFYLVIPYYHKLVYGYFISFIWIANLKSFLSTAALLLLAILIIALILYTKISKLQIMDLLRAEM